MIIIADGGSTKTNWCLLNESGQKIYFNTEDMLIFILYDYRHNPTQDFMGLHFNLPQPKVAMWIKVLDPLLLDSLKQMKIVPQRESNSLDDRLIGSVTVLLDGSERPINRPKYEQEEYYSGKKRNIRLKIT